MYQLQIIFCGLILMVQIKAYINQLKLQIFKVLIQDHIFLIGDKVKDPGANVTL
jgi:hypothetical protein